MTTIIKANKITKSFSFAVKAIDEVNLSIKSGEVVVFMKGTPDFPQCGFSANVIGILNYFNIKFTSFNVLEDNLIREGIKNYSNWPTIPQIYIKEEFVGGCDIFRELAENGEIEDLFQKHDIKYQVEEN